MGDPKPLALGDPCPACGGPLVRVPQPTAAQRAAAAHHEQPQFFPVAFDTAPLDVVHELGELHRCASCRYSARFHPAPPAEPAAPAIGN